MKVVVILMAVLAILSVSCGRVTAAQLEMTNPAEEYASSTLEMTNPAELVTSIDVNQANIIYDNGVNDALDEVLRLYDTVKTPLSLEQICDLVREKLLKEDS
jgi:hypothetical protein